LHLDTHHLPANVPVSVNINVLVLDAPVQPSLILTAKDIYLF